MPGESAYNIRTPWLVDDDYFRSGFAYTRLQEQDWTELYLSVGNKYLTGEVALMGSLYSDWAQPLIDHQWGIAQGFLRFHWDADGPRARFASTPRPAPSGSGSAGCSATTRTCSRARTRWAGRCASRPDCAIGRSGSCRASARTSRRSIKTRG